MTPKTDEELKALASEQYGIDFSAYTIQAMAIEVREVDEGRLFWDSEEGEREPMGREPLANELAQITVAWKVPKGFMALYLVEPDLKEDAQYAGMFVLVKL